MLILTDTSIHTTKTAPVRCGAHCGRSRSKMAYSAINCKECPYKNYDGRKYTCMINDFPVNIIKHINSSTAPKWCPVLKEKKEASDAV